MSVQSGGKERPRPRASGHAAFWSVGVAFGCLLSTPPAQAQKAAPELGGCVAANRQAATELLQDRDSEIRRHALHAVLVSRLQGLGGGFAQLRATAARAPRNLAECEKTSEALVAGREQMERIVGTPAQLAECSAANQAAFAKMQATLLDLQGSGKVSAPTLETAASRLALLRPALTRDGLTLADCRQLTADMGVEVSQVQRLVPPAPAARPAAATTTATTTAIAAVPGPESASAAASAVAAATASTACRASLTRSYNEVAQAYAQFVGAGPIGQELMAPLQGLSERLTRLSVSISAPASPAWDCEGLQRALAQARSDLGQLKR